ncbi:MAG: hypothetical protein LKM37_03105 [Bacteroidales bacterium]|jgi:thiamine-monophosphate kinase|nr:hypothetical protein [Bacteroidales bacterium]
MAEKENKAAKTPQRTEIKELGRIKALDKLFEKTSYKNNDVQFFGGKLSADKSDDYYYMTANRMMMEGVDFDLTYTPIKYLGYKMAIYAMGPLYAHNYAPYVLSFTVGLSAKFSYENVDWLWAGIQAAAKEHNIFNVTIDLNSSMTGLIISCTSVGRQEKKIVDAWPKADKNSLLCVTGNLGAAYMGLHVLEREKVAFGNVAPEQMKNYKQPDLSKYKYILSQYLTPEISSKCIDNFKDAGFFPSTGCFIAKGLGDAVKQICKETGFGAKVYIDKIPIAPESRAMADEIDIDIITSVINGGDDYRLLYVVPLEKHEQLHKEMADLDVIGHLCPADEGTALVTPDGRSLEIKVQGWE